MYTRSWCATCALILWSRAFIRGACQSRFGRVPVKFRANLEFREVCFLIGDLQVYWRRNWRILRRLVRKLLDTVAHSGPAVLVRCSAGRDRTGVISTLLLGHAGVSSKTLHWTIHNRLRPWRVQRPMRPQLTVRRSGHRTLCGRGIPRQSKWCWKLPWIPTWNLIPSAWAMKRARTYMRCSRSRRFCQLPDPWLSTFI